jgi:hypothetical protein
MALNSYPNIAIVSTGTTLTPEYNGAIITSTYASSVSLTVTSVLAAGFRCELIQTGAGAMWVTADTGASINSTTGGAVATSTQYSRAVLTAYTDGNFIIDGSIA